MSSNGSKNLSIYRKAAELQTLSQAIALCVARGQEMLHLHRSNSLRDQVAACILTDAALIRKQVDLAASTRSLHMRQKSLHFIQIMIRNLNSYCKGLEMDGVREREYLELMRQEIKGFRRTFNHWRRSLGN
jgi:hypothetical protein